MKELNQDLQKAKELFVAQHWGQHILIDVDNSGTQQNYPIERSNMYRIDESFLSLRTIDMLTDEEIIQIAQFAQHQKPNGKFKVRRDTDITHAELTDSVGITYHISLRKNTGTVNANMHFSRTETEPFSTYKVNIGEISISSELPIPYLAIADFMRSIGILLQFTYLDSNNKPITLQPAEILELGWAKIKKI